MTIPPRTSRNAAAALACLLAAVAPAHALEITSWQNRQSVPIERTGVIKFALPPATLDRARADLGDLRLLDPAGRETPFAIERAAPVGTPAMRASRSFRATLVNGSTQIILETGTTAPLIEVVLASPAPAFLKPARLEISADGQEWEIVQRDVPLFRQFGAEQLRFDLERRTTAWIRITLDDSRTKAVPITGATLALAATSTPPVTTPLPARIVRRDEYAGESVLTLDIGGAHVSLASLRFVAADALFVRNISIAVRELHEGTASERVLATGMIYRVAAEGLPPRGRLDVPLDVAAPSRELLVHISNGDSPPLTGSDVGATQRPTWLVFAAGAPGSYVLLTGNADVAPARYDLASLAASLKDVVPSAIAVGAIEDVPGYQRTDVLAAVVLRGALLDPAPWNFRKPVHLATAGVQQLELDPEVLAAAQRDLADLRLVRDGAQVPYLLERPPLSRPAPLAFSAGAIDPKRPSLSRWAIKLPRAGLPLTQLTLTSPAPLFQRHVRAYEKLSDDRGGSYERTLAAGDWNKTPGHENTLALGLTTALTTDTLWLETDNGDNPPLVLGAITASYPVARLLFKTEAAPDTTAAAAGLALYYGNREAASPRYDLELIAGQILAAEKTAATLGPEEAARAGGWANRALTGPRATYALWAALAIVVVVLLVVVARLLPKPPAAD
jgi:hypothetical protein